MIAINQDGDFVANATGQLTETTFPEQQNYMAETRCLQGTWPPNTLFGRNPLIWGISQSVKDRIDDLTRIGQQYLVVRSITSDLQGKVYNISC